MTAQDSLTALKKMTTRRSTSPVVEVPLSAARACRLSMARAAEASVGLVLTVAELTEENLTLDDMVATLSGDDVLLGLARGKTTCGLMACDLELVAAVVEMRTTGKVAARAPQARRITGTDIALLIPLATALLRDLGETTRFTTLAQWTDGVGPAARFETARAVGLALVEGTYRTMRLTLTLGPEGRKGAIALILPVAGDIAAPAAPEPAHNWSEDFSATVMEAPATLTAVLHRWEMPLAKAIALTVGQVVPLPGCTIGSVRLEAPNGTLIARGRLGQIGGNIAVRVGMPDVVGLTDLTPAQTVYDAEISTDSAGDDVADGDAAATEFEMPDPMPQAAPVPLDADMSEPLADLADDAATADAATAPAVAAPES